MISMQFFLSLAPILMHVSTEDVRSSVVPDAIALTQSLNEMFHGQVLAEIAKVNLHPLSLTANGPPVELTPADLVVRPILLTVLQGDKEEDDDDADDDDADDDAHHENKKRPHAGRGGDDRERNNERARNRNTERQPQAGRPPFSGPPQNREPRFNRPNSNGPQDERGPRRGMQGPPAGRFRNQQAFGPDRRSMPPHSMTGPGRGLEGSSGLIFELLDLNHDGQLSRDEFQRLVDATEKVQGGSQMHGGPMHGDQMHSAQMHGSPMHGPNDRPGDAPHPNHGPRPGEHRGPEDHRSKESHKSHSPDSTMHHNRGPDDHPNMPRGFGPPVRPGRPESDSRSESGSRPGQDRSGRPPEPDMGSADRPSHFDGAAERHELQPSGRGYSGAPHQLDAAQSVSGGPRFGRAIDTNGNGTVEQEEIDRLPGFTRAALDMRGLHLHADMSVNDLRFPERNIPKFGELPTY